MTVSRGTGLFIAFALLVSAGCVRLGFWQLDRLRERRAANAAIIAQLADSPRAAADLFADSAPRFRRAVASGWYDFANEFVLTSRSRNGAPGVHVITPLRQDGRDTAILVNRGWIYAPDGMRADLSHFREDSTATVDGFVEVFVRGAGGGGPVATPSVARAVRRLDRDSIAAMLPYPIAPILVVQRRDSGEAAAVARGTPVRADPPPLDEGPHRSYAVQWFAFALVGVVGSVLVATRDRRRTAAPSAE